jgi:Major Facilitator Superfamily
LEKVRKLDLVYSILLETGSTPSFSGACFLTYWTKTYRGLFVCRTLTGFSMGGALPLIYSLLGDMFRADERHKVNSFLGMGTGLGIALGQAIAGFLGPTFGWRLPFLLVATPALICAAIVLVTVEEPERGGMEQAAIERKNCSATTDGDNATSYENENVSKEVEMQRLTGTEDSDDTNKPKIPRAGISMVRRRSKDYPVEDKKNEESEKDGQRVILAESTKTKSFIRLLWDHVEPTMQTMRILFKTPTVIFALLQGVPGCLPWGIGEFFPRFQIELH